MPSHDTEALVFQPIFMERIWGGRQLESVFGKKLPAGKRIGESWEIVDRPEAQSVVRQGALQGKTLHELWVGHRAQIFGADVPDAARFPILIKLLDATEKLSLQVHPPAEIASSLGGEPKSEFWYFAASKEGAEIFAGLRSSVNRDAFAMALRGGSVGDLVHRIAVRSGDSFVVPGGRLHGIGEGNLIVEVQQNSDTTYRIFDWERKDEKGERRQLHISESMRAINFADYEPQIRNPGGERLVNFPHFVVERWKLEAPRPASTDPAFAIFLCLSGIVQVGEQLARPGELFLVPAIAAESALRPAAPETVLLRITLPVR